LRIGTIGLAITIFSRIALKNGFSEFLPHKRASANASPARQGSVSHKWEKDSRAARRLCVLGRASIAVERLIVAAAIENIGDANAVFFDLVGDHGRTLEGRRAKARLQIVARATAERSITDTAAFFADARRKSLRRGRARRRALDIAVNIFEIVQRLGPKADLNPPHRRAT
jgi:hypothetical protein